MMMFAIALMAAQAGTLQPKGKWQVSPDIFTCALGHQYSRDGRDFTVLITPQETTGSYDLLLVGDADAITSVPVGSRAQIQIDDETLPQSYAWTQDLKEGRRLLNMRLAGAALPVLEARSGNLKISSGTIAYALPTDGLAAALPLFQSCHFDALRRLKLDPALWQEKRLARLGNPGKFFASEVPPKGRTGTVVVVVTTDSTGRILDCYPTNDLRRDLADHSCRIIRKNISPKPAVDEAGRPIAGYALLRVEISRR